MRVYLSGSMTGHPDLNRQAFDAAERRLTAQGHFVINPVNISVTFGVAEELAASFRVLYGIPASPLDPAFMFPEIAARLARAVMDADLAAVRSCDAIYLLKGWKTSRGARRELAEALKYGLEIFEEGGEE